MIPSLGVKAKVSPAAGTTLKTGLISVWEFEETSGSTTYDSHGSNNLTISSGVTLNQTGKTGKCFSFNGSTGQLATSSASDFEGLGDFSIAAWTYSSYATSSNDYRIVFSKTLSTWVSPYYQIQLRMRHYNINSWECFFGTSNNFAGIVQNGVYSTNAWTHVAVTRDAFTGDMDIYINGQHMGSPTRTQLPLTGNTGTASTPIIVGDDADLVSSFYNWNGLIDQMAVWNKVLSSSEISDLYNSGDGLHYNNW
jgi:hypothetical protein